MSDTPNIPRLVLIDTSWVKHRAFHAYQSLTAQVDGVTVPTGTLYGFVVLMGQLRKHFPDWTYIFAYDAGRGGREKVYEWYKDNRNHDPRTGRFDPQIRQFLSYKHQSVLAEAAGFEADDVIAMFARSPAPQSDVVIYSSDNDMFQLVRDDPERRVRILRSMTPEKQGGPLEFLGEKDCVERYGVAPNQLLLYRSLVGDESDCIPPVVTGMRKALAVQLAQRYKQPSDVLQETEWINEQHKSLMSAESIVAWGRNFNVMSFRRCAPMDTAIHSLSEQVLCDMAERYQMKSLLKFL